MKTCILAAVTLDGFIAHGPKDEAIDWTSAEDKAWIKDITTRARAVVTGSHTFFHTLKGPLSDRQNIVLTHHPELQKTQPRTIFTNDPPQLILEKLEGEGYKEAVIFGGGQIFELFLQANLVDVLYLTIAPHIFGKGIEFPYTAIVGKTQWKTSRQLGPGELMHEFTIRR